jgi:hypothetical protein
LRDMGVLKKEREGGGRGADGFGRTVHYRLMESALPKRGAWKEQPKKGATVAPLSKGNGAELPIQQRILLQRTPQPSAPYPKYLPVRRTEPSAEVARVSSEVDKGMNQGRTFWTGILKIAQASMTPERWKLFQPRLEATRLVDRTGGLFIVGAPNAEFAGWLRDNAQDLLLESIHAAGGDPEGIEFLGGPDGSPGRTPPARLPAKPRTVESAPKRLLAPRVRRMRTPALFPGGSLSGSF